MLQLVALHLDLHSVMREALQQQQQQMLGLITTTAAAAAVRLVGKM
jgi:hypothetical protein